jgi:hypothetical protein
MICFRDMTFCCSEQHASDCDRQWTPELQAQAERWWGSANAPVAFSAFCGGELRVPVTAPATSS